MSKLGHMTTQPHGLIPEWSQGDRFRKAREHVGMSVRDFAAAIGVSHQTVTNAEKGHVKVRPITIKAWALATGVDAQWLETGHQRTTGSPPDGSTLPRLDSNQQPFGYGLSLVRTPRHLSPVKSAA